ncbi:hypothetical protein QVD17_19981 [Tagetes erecta]|uniref:DUF4408 domain-containing protein n=1 Tax=Tagetes erecta TaxID=13708 RepID=A0AAD8KQR6_TARER|nr:hypothetical protein QVD17_19981 [Tagetes erecta]
MATPSSSSSSTNSWLLSLKLLLITIAVVSIAVTMKLTVPLMLNTLPSIWSVIITWLKPPYLYVVINAIIITIAATTRFQHNHQVDYPSPPSSDLTSELSPVSNPMETYDVETVEPMVVYERKLSDLDLKTVMVPEFDSLPPVKTIQPEIDFPVKEKQLVASRFAHNRKPVKANPEGVRALRVLKPKKHETLETTWKMITDGRQLPLTRHLRKSDTFDNRHETPSESSPAETTKTKVVKKSETFKDRTVYANQNDYPAPAPAPAKLSPATGTKLKKDVSLGHDELNRRVEAFIKKFNDDMKLQRQESLKHYMEMVKSGAR